MDCVLVRGNGDVVEKSDESETPTPTRDAMRAQVCGVRVRVRVRVVETRVLADVSIRTLAASESASTDDVRVLAHANAERPERRSQGVREQTPFGLRIERRDDGVFVRVRRRRGRDSQRVRVRCGTKRQTHERDAVAD